MPVCNLATNMCGPALCSSDQDCTGYPTLPTCDFTFSPPPFCAIEDETDDVMTICGSESADVDGVSSGCYVWVMMAVQSGYYGGQACSGVIPYDGDPHFDWEAAYASVNAACKAELQIPCAAGPDGTIQPTTGYCMMRSCSGDLDCSTDEMCISPDAFGRCVPRFCSDIDAVSACADEDPHSQGVVSDDCFQRGGQYATFLYECDEVMSKEDVSVECKQALGWPCGSSTRVISHSSSASLSPKRLKWGGSMAQVKPTITLVKRAMAQAKRAAAGKVHLWAAEQDKLPITHAKLPKTQGKRGMAQAKSAAAAGTAQLWTTKKGSLPMTHVKRTVLQAKRTAAAKAHVLAAGRRDAWRGKDGVYFQTRLCAIVREPVCVIE